MRPGTAACMIVAIIALALLFCGAFMCSGATAQGADLPPDIGEIPVQERGEGDSWLIDLTLYVSDPDTPFEQLEISALSSKGQFAKVVGAYLVFEYPAEVESDAVTLTVSDGNSTVQALIEVELDDGGLSISEVLERDGLLTYLVPLLVIAVIGLAVFAMRERFSTAEGSGIARDPLIVKDAFLVYHDGCLLAHTSLNLRTSFDEDIMTGMLTAIQDFVRDSFKDEGEWDIKNISFGKSQISIERGRDIYLAVVYSGRYSELLRERMIFVIENIERYYGDVLHGWDGDLDAIRGAKELMAPLFISEDDLEKHYAGQLL